MKTNTKSNMQAVKGYFRNNPKFGRTTKLVVSGVVVLEVMGVCPLKALAAQYQNQLARN